MRTKDYEQALDAWQGAVKADEIVLGKGGQVRAMYGHDLHCWIKWDEFGRSFTCYSDAEIALDEVHDPRNEVEEWERNTVYDLKFE